MDKSLLANWRLATWRDELSVELRIRVRDLESTVGEEMQRRRHLWLWREKCLGEQSQNLEIYRRTSAKFAWGFGN